MVKAVDASGSPEAAPAPALPPAAPAPPWWARAARFLFRDRPELVLSPLALVLLIYAWYAITSARLVAPVLLPSPGAVARALKVLLTAPWFPPNLWTTLLEAILGFLIAAVLAVAVAVLMDQIRLIRRVGYPYVVVLQVMPSVVLAPIFIVWFGFGISSKIVVSVSTAFFVILVNTLSGLASVPENSRLLMRSMCASRRQMFFKLTLPTAAPFVFAAFKTAATLSLIGALVGEFITARSGLGRLLTQFSFALRQDMMFATVLVVGAVGIALYGLVAFLEKRVIWWR
jgi:NitT/TauT family transport system permease protein